MATILAYMGIVKLVREIKIGAVLRDVIDSCDPRVMLLLRSFNKTMEFCDTIFLLKMWTD